MAHSILISSPDVKWSSELRDFLLSAGHQCVVALTGKECQLLAHKEKFSFVLLDIDTSNHSGLEVLKFLKLKCPSLKVLLCFQNKVRYQEVNLDTKALNKMGICKTLIRPFIPQTILQFLEEMKSPSRWREAATSNKLAEEPERRINDSECTRIKMETFLTGNVAVFNYYIRISTNKYVKILKEGESFDPERLKKYISEGVEYLYFLTKDRLTYINYMNEMTKRTLSSSKPVDPSKIVGALRNVSDKLIEEVYTKGLQENLVEESKAYSQNMFDFMRKNEALKKILYNYMEIDPATQSHVFLVSFFTTLIGNNLDWVGPKTRETLVLGSFLHDIGMLKLPANIRDKAPETMVEKELDLYYQHPKLGAEMLANVPGINPQVIQIVYQHHELTTGTGFPLALSASKIYPLAKIICLADAFTDILILNRLTPIEGIKSLFQQRDKLVNYDASAMRALANAFIQEK